MNTKETSGLDDARVKQRKITRLKFFNNFIKNELVLSLFINIILFTLFFLVFTPFFETNDDIGMMEIASGVRYGEPSEYIIFMNVILGFLLKFLYQNFASLNWYVIFFYLLHFFSMTVILYVFLKQSKSLYSILLYTLLFVFFEVFFLANLQFTTTAMITGCSGLISLIVAGKRNQKWTFYISGILLLIISGWVRFNVFILLMSLFIPFIFLKVLQTRKITLLVPVFVSGLIILGTAGVHNFYYARDPHWKHYSQYNSLRANITDFQYTQYNATTKDVYSAIGWSANDVYLFRHWISFDQNIYTIDALAHITSNIDRGDQKLTEIIKTLNRVFKKIAPNRLGLSFLTVVVALFFVKKHERILVISMLVMTISAIFYLAYFGRLPIRVLHSILFNMNLISLYMLSRGNYLVDNKKSMIGSRKIFTIVALILFCVVLSSAVYVDFRHNERRIKAAERAGIDDAIDELSKQEFVYAIAPGLLKNFKISLYNNINIDFKAIGIGGSAVPSPLHNNEISKYGIEPNFPALIRDDILIIAKDDQLQKLTKSLRENYQIYVTFVPVIKVKNHVAFSLVKTAGPVAPTGQVADERPTFQWTPLENVTSYQIQLRRDRDLIDDFFVKPAEEFCSDRLCSRQFARTIPTGDLRWRVRAKINDSWQPWSDFIDFSIVDN